jgi:hypothetical protein
MGGLAAHKPGRQASKPSWANSTYLAAVSDELVLNQQGGGGNNFLLVQVCSAGHGPGLACQAGITGRLGAQQRVPHLGGLALSAKRTFNNYDSVVVLPLGYLGKLGCTKHTPGHGSQEGPNQARRQEEQ